MWVDVAIGSVVAWLGLGAMFAVPFVTLGVQRIDPLARGATPGFRLAIVPGVLIFWPLLAARWMAGRREPPLECNAHRRHAVRLAAGGRKGETS